MGIQPKVYFMGGSGVGKSTLAAWVSQVFNLPLVTGATARAREHLGVSFDDVFRDPVAANRYQARVWHEQLALEEEFWSGDLPNETGFVSDRGLDLLAYTAEMATNLWQIVRDERFQDYTHRLRNYAVVFFVRPHPSIRPDPDGRRDQFLGDDFVHRIDGAIQTLLNAHEVPYIPVTTPSMVDRQRLVRAVLRLASRS